MVMLVTLEQASEHLRRDTTDDDADLTLKIQAASNGVVNYLKNEMLAYQYDVDVQGIPVLDSSGDLIYLIDSAGDYVARQEVQAAVLMIIGVFYADRSPQAYMEKGGEPRLGNMSLPKAVHWLLDPLRTPSIA